jgi:hypothetical protein
MGRPPLHHTGMNTTTPTGPPKETEVLERIRDFFVHSSDFNGIPIKNLKSNVALSSDQLRSVLESLINQGRITLSFASVSVNPHVKRTADMRPSEQLEHLAGALRGVDQCCAYPSASVIREATDLSQYDERPFGRRLALAEPHLTPVFFSLDVLKRYFDDPRYQFTFHDYEGSVSVVPAHYDSSEMRERDKVFLASFGIGYDTPRRRVVAVFLRYLSDLTPEHQQSWRSYMIDEPCSINGDYERSAVWGEWPKHRSAYEALIATVAELNKLCEVIGKPPLFLTTERPKTFAPMLLPTKRNFNAFTLVLDQLLSDNINRDFFRGDVELERRVPWKDGVIERQQKGTLTLLEEWLDSHYTDANGQRVGKEVGELMRDVRKLRQAPAHRADDDAYDDRYPKEQDVLVSRGVTSLTKLRLVLMSHPAAKGKYEAPEWLDSNLIVFY